MVRNHVALARRAETKTRPCMIAVPVMTNRQRSVYVGIGILPMNRGSSVFRR